MRSIALSGFPLSPVGTCRPVVVPSVMFDAAQRADRDSSAIAFICADLRSVVCEMPVDPDEGRSE
jgi:hypothetical protein